MKKYLIYTMCLVLALSLTGCKSKDYEKAIGYYNDGMYEEAAAIFTELGDYKDSSDRANEANYEFALELLEDGEFDDAEEIFVALGDYEDAQEYLDSMGFLRLAAYITENGEIVKTTSIIEGATDTVTVSCEKNTITIEKKMEMNTDTGNDMVMGQTLVLTKGSNTARFGDALEMKIGNGLPGSMSLSSSYNCEVDWDIRGSVEDLPSEWDLETYNDTLGIAKSLVSPPNEKANSLKSLLNELKTVLDESGLDITMDDLGFISWTDE